MRANFFNGCHGKKKKKILENVNRTTRENHFSERKKKQCDCLNDLIVQMGTNEARCMHSRNSYKLGVGKKGEKKIINPDLMGRIKKSKNWAFVEMNLKK